MYQRITVVLAALTLACSVTNAASPTVVEALRRKSAITRNSGSPLPVREAVPAHVADQVEKHFCPNGVQYWASPILNPNSKRTFAHNRIGRPGTRPGIVDFDPERFMLDTTISYNPDPGPQYGIGVASDGTDFLIVWNDWSVYPTAVRGARVTADGTILDPTGFVIAGNVNPYFRVAASWNGTSYLVVWESGYEWEGAVRGTRVTPAGEILDPDGFTISNEDVVRMCASVVSCGDRWLVTWNEFSYETFTMGVKAARIAADGSVVDPGGFTVAVVSEDCIGHALGADRSGYLVAWETRTDTGSTGVMAARANPDQGLVDSAGIPVTAQDGFRHPGSITSDGSGFMVFWSQEESGETRSYASRITAAGELVDTNGIELRVGAEWYHVGFGWFDGTDYFATYFHGLAGDTLGRTEIRTGRITTEGMIRDTVGAVVETTQNFCYSFGLASSQGGHIAAWSEDPQFPVPTRFARIGPGGEVLTPGGLPLLIRANRQLYTASAFDGTNYLSVFLDDRRTGNFDVYFTRQDANGNALDPESRLLALTTTTGYTLPPTVGFDGANYLAVWCDIDTLQWTGKVLGTRIAPDGMVLDSPPVLVAEDCALMSFPDVAFDGTNYLVAWTAQTDQDNIFCARISPAGEVLDPQPFPVCTDPGSRGWPRLAFDGTNYLATWIEQHGDQQDIYAARITPEGNVLEPHSILVCWIAGDQVFPSVAFDGTNYCVTWSDLRNLNDFDLYGARVTPAGVVLDVCGRPLCELPADQFCSVIACAGDNRMMVWGEGVVFYGPARLCGAKLDAELNLTDSFPLASGPGNNYWPELAVGADRQVLLSYTGYIREYHGRGVDQTRVWGSFTSLSGIGESGRLPLSSDRQLVVWPNPFTDQVRIEVSAAPGLSPATALSIYDPSGRRVRRIPLKPAGARKESAYSVRWNGTDDHGRLLPRGSYIIRVEAADGRSTVRQVRLLR